MLHSQIELSALKKKKKKEEDQLSDLISFKHGVLTRRRLAVLFIEGKINSN